MGVFYNSKGILPKGANTHTYLYSRGIKVFQNIQWYGLKVIFTVSRIHSFLKNLNTHPTPLNILTLEHQMHPSDIFLSLIHDKLLNSSLVIISILVHTILCTRQYHIILSYVLYFFMKQSSIPQWPLFLLVDIPKWLIYLWSCGCSLYSYIHLVWFLGTYACIHLFGHYCLTPNDHGIFYKFTYTHCLPLRSV